MKVCGQRQDAEDTMQEVLLKSVPNLPKFDNPKALMVWLYKVAKNRCLMSRRKSKFAPKEDLSLEELMPDRQELQKLSGNPDGTPETSLLRRENAKRLREAVQRLPAEYRLILVLHDMEELSDSDVAEITGLRLGTIRVRLHRARLFVRKELAKQDQHRIRRQTGETLTRKCISPRSRANGAARKCSPNSQTTLMTSLMIPFVKNWKSTWTAASPARHSYRVWRSRSNSAERHQMSRPTRVSLRRLRRELMAEYQGLMSKITRQASDAIEVSLPNLRIRFHSLTDSTPCDYQCTFNIHLNPYKSQ